MPDAIQLKEVTKQMQFYDAKVADLLRCNQRDETFMNEIENEFHTVLRYAGARHYYKLRSSIPVMTRVWYYCMTSLANIQTLGEEYTGTIRVGACNRTPTKMVQTLWLILYVGGEPLLDRFIDVTEIKIRRSTSITFEAKSVLFRCLNLFKANKSLLKRIHQSVFYTNGKYYNISNRLTGIKYVLVREWLQDDSYTGSFKLLGKLSLLYVLFTFVHQIMTLNKDDEADTVSSITSTSSKGCILCGENINNACATSCGHIFCWDCIYDSLGYQKNCPICREPVKQSRIIFLQNFR